MVDISPFTNQLYYSGNIDQIIMIVRALNIGEGKLSKISQEMVNKYQEMVDREIDGQLNDLYYTPLKPYNVNINGTVKSIFPGNIARLAKYWVAGLLMMSEFQGLEPNVLEACQNYVDQAQKNLFRIAQYSQRIEGQEYRARLRTMPPNFQPSANPQPDF